MNGYWTSRTKLQPGRVIRQWFEVLVRHNTPRGPDMHWSALWIRLDRVTLFGANLTDANLAGVDLTEDQLNAAKWMSSATDG